MATAQRRVYYEDRRLRVSTNAELRALYGKAPQLTDVAPEQGLDPRRAAFLRLAPLAMVFAPDTPENAPVFLSGDPAAARLMDARTVLLPLRPEETPVAAARSLLAAEELRVEFILPGAPMVLVATGVGEIRLETMLRQAYGGGEDIPLAVLRLLIVETAFRPAAAFQRAGIWDPDCWPDLAELDP